MTMMSNAAMRQLALAALAVTACALQVPSSGRPQPQPQRTTTTTTTTTVDEWYPAARSFGKNVIRVYTSAEAFAAAAASGMASRANADIAALFEWEHRRAASCPRARAAHTSYWDDPRIHNFGNCGWRGMLHALVVPIATHAIDRFAYAGIDVRKQIHETLIPDDYDVVDLGCGVGFSCARNGRCRGVDTSKQMLSVARLRRPDVEFEEGNSEEWGEDKCCDMVTIMYNFHEMPGHARRKVLRNARRIARRSVLVVDIWPGFEPTPMMLSGEPYVHDYLTNIEDDVAATVAHGGWTASRLDLVHEHVTVWKIERDESVEEPIEFDI